MRFNQAEKNFFYVNNIPALRNWVVTILLLILTIFILFLYSIRKMFQAEFIEKCNKDAYIKLLQESLYAKDEQIQNLKERYSREVNFFTSISHELKTPLSVILGALQLIEQKDLHKTIHNTQSEEDPHSLFKESCFYNHKKAIKQNCYRLLRLVNNILDISRIDAGFMKLNLTNCNLVNLAGEITRSILPYAEQKNLKLEFVTECDQIMTALDINIMERILLNLLSNAIKFTDSDGNIYVSVLRSGEDSVLIIIRDTGRGIPANMHSKIFERFNQSDNQTLKNIEGTGSGIGLSLVKAFVGLLNGSIYLKSEENVGSEFKIEIPITTIECNNKNYVSSIQDHSRIFDSIKIELSDIYSSAS